MNSASGTPRTKPSMAAATLTPRSNVPSPPTVTIRSRCPVRAASSTRGIECRGCPCSTRRSLCSGCRDRVPTHGRFAPWSPRLAGRRAPPIRLHSSLVQPSPVPSHTAAPARRGLPAPRQLVASPIHPVTRRWDLQRPSSRGVPHKLTSESARASKARAEADSALRRINRKHSHRHVQQAGRAHIQTRSQRLSAACPGIEAAQVDRSGATAAVPQRYGPTGSAGKMRMSKLSRAGHQPGQPEGRHQRVTSSLHHRWTGVSTGWRTTSSGRHEPGPRSLQLRSCRSWAWLGRAERSRRFERRWLRPI
jgi:hypothetical protein